MKENINYFKELPENYVCDLVMDATSKKFKLWGNVFSFILLILTLFICVVLRLQDFKELDSSSINYVTFIKYIVMFIGLFVYMVLHEIVHGIAYKILTGEKLKFGVKFPVAYCGVPGIYSIKKTALISLLAPFITFNIILIPLMCFTNNIIDYAFISFIFAGHVSGCIFDLYDSYLLIFKYHGKSVLMFDDGPVQKFYVK